MVAVHETPPYFTSLATVGRSPETEEIRARLVEEHAAAVELEGALLRGLSELTLALGVERWALLEDFEILASSAPDWESLSAEEDAVAREAARAEGRGRWRARLADHYWRALPVAGGRTLLALIRSGARPLPETGP